MKDKIEEIIIKYADDIHEYAPLGAKMATKEILKLLKNNPL